MRKIFTVLLSLMLLTSCSSGFQTESLLSPPKLSAEQEAIYAALTRSVGERITLKYPRSGQYRSAVTVADIDGDGGTEAIAFYEREASINSAKTTNTANESPLRMNILDKNAAGDWYSVYDHTGVGTDVDRLIISPLGSSPTPLLTVGFIQVSGSKTARIYSYVDNRLSGDFSDNYELCFTVDINRDSRYELCLLHKSSNDRDAFVSLVSVEGNLIYEWGSAPLSKGAVDFPNIVSGALTAKTAALYIDSSNGEETRTDIVYSPAPGRLRNPMYLPESNLSDMTVRAAGLYSSDIDGDGLLEIPVTAPFPGYGNFSSVPESLQSVNWIYLDNYRLVKKYSSYYAADEGYAFLFPGRWDGVVTVRIDEETLETVFVKYTPGADLADMPELLRIAMTEGGNPGRIEDLDTYKHMVTKDNFDYYIKNTAPSDEPLSLTEAEINNSFRML
ncbi:MAG: hypothetical protein LBM41_05900 [Ruminococcus sp.]|jgi:hypothetical protein|nr:hypothetical protein [Ruminococcus sp.]